MFRAGLILSTLITAACGGGGEENPELAKAEITVLSSRSDMVTNGDALIAVQLPAAAASAKWKIFVNDVDRTESFKESGSDRKVGLVSSLVVGSNKVRVVAEKDGYRSSVAEMTLRNWKRDEPILAGPRQSPWVCETQSKILPDGSTLGAAIDSDCNAPTKINYVYKSSTSDRFVPLPTLEARPADMATRTTDSGRVVNYIVRVETGTLNRAIYQFAVPYDPDIDESSFSPNNHYVAWNRKLVYLFGGSSSAGYIQGTQTGNELAGVMQDFMLSRGFAVAGSSLNVMGTNSSDVLSAETASKVKELFIKTYGQPLYTMGWGGSGGAMQQHLIANNYPGILDGITPNASFPDLISLAPTALDCSLLSRAFGSTGVAWTGDQKTAVAGYANWTECDASSVPSLGWMQAYTPGWMLATPTNIPAMTFELPSGPLVVDYNNCHVQVARSLLYDPVANPQGARCDLYSGISTLVGVDPATGFARRAYDNVGVVFGLKAFNAGKISALQLVELNEKVGGYDVDGQFQMARTVGDAVALENIFKFGRLNNGANMGSIPVIDYRNFSEHQAAPDLHDSVRSMIMRERLVKTNGNHANQIVWRAAPTVDLSSKVLASMDEWLLNIRSDTQPRASQAERSAAGKPSGLADTCFASADQAIVETASFGSTGECGRLMPYYENPRLAAGEPLTGDILKCQLKPLQKSDFPGLDDSLFARLSAVFPGGICDYTRPSAGQRALSGSWLVFSNRGVAAPLQ